MIAYMMYGTDLKAREFTHDFLSDELGDFSVLQVGLHTLLIPLPENAA
jgi:hypothetical protein